VLTTDTLVAGRYQLGEVIGRGGGADVYRSDDLESGRVVAVKVLRSATPNDLKRFGQEAETLSRLDHPAIVRMCDRGEFDGVPYLVLDLIDGETLATRLQRGPLSAPEVTRIGSVLAGALAHAHSIGVVHRDVKPGNVMFDASDAVHLTDFGIARLTDVTSITSTGFVIGTPAYLAPEQVTGEGAGPAADIYALGLVLIEALTGEREFAGPPSEAALARLHREPKVPPSATGPLGALLASMISADPRLRPSAASVADALALAAEDDHHDATTILPIASDATTAIPLPTDAVVAAAPVAAIRQPRRPRRAVIAPLVAAAIVALIIFGLSTSGGELKPATAITSTTVATTAPTTAPPTTVADTTPPNDHRGKGKKGD